MPGIGCAGSEKGPNRAPHLGVMLGLGGLNRRSITVLFLILDLLIYVDRGIVPGTHQEIVTFIGKQDAIRWNPELYYGALQSVFIAGLAIAAPLLTTISVCTPYTLRLVAIGLLIWMSSLLFCGISGSTGSVGMLFIFRALSGVGEAAFVSLVAPMLLDIQPRESKGMFLGLFYGLMPGGVAVGFLLSSLNVHFGGTWESNFYILAALSAFPIGIVASYSKLDNSPNPFKPNRDTFENPKAANKTRFFLTTCSLISNPSFILFLIAGSAQAAVSASLSSFGTAFLLDLGVFRSEFQAASLLGSMAAGVGAVGTLLGGIALEYKTTNVQINRSVHRPWIRRYSHESHSGYKDRLYMLIHITETVQVFGIIGSIVSVTSPLLLIMGFPFLSLAQLALGLLMIFMTQSGLNLGVMSSADVLYRSFALSVYTLGIHIFGDVPGPIIVGYLKDKFAPHCGPLGDRALCHSERNGLLFIMFLFLGWTGFIGLAMATCYRISRSSLKSIVGRPSEPEAEAEAEALLTA